MEEAQRSYAMNFHKQDVPCRRCRRRDDGEVQDPVRRPQALRDGVGAGDPYRKSKGKGMNRTFTTRLPPASVIARHWHATAYATLVLDGGYEEAGDAGRHRVDCGDVLLHGDFSAHRDVTGNKLTILLDLPLPFGRRWPARAKVHDPDHVVRLAQTDVRAASEALVAGLLHVEGGERELVDALAAALDTDAVIGVWAADIGSRRETLSRHFSRSYGIDPAGYRRESRARRAWRMIVTTSDSLAHIAAETGHSDQAHMTRAVRKLTGVTPGDWRKSVTSVQEAALVSR